MNMKKFILSTLLISACTLTQAQAPGGVSSGLQVWLKGDAGTSTTIDGQFLSYWNDQSGNGNNATQATGSAQPKYIKRALNGNPAMEGNNGTRYLNVNLNSIDNNAFTVISVVKRASSSANQYFIGIQQASPSPGFHMGYVNNTTLRYANYGNTLNQTVGAYSATTEGPRIVIGECNTSFNKGLTEVNNGVASSSSNGNILHYTQGAMGNIGRGFGSSGFQGYISEVIVYNRTLTALEKRQIQTYLSIKYGLSIAVADHLYYNEPTFANDVFGIGKDVALQGLNQTESKSENPDDIVTIKEPSNMSDGEFLVSGNNNGSTAMATYSGSNCSVTNLMARVWKVRETGDVGTVTMRFNMTGITGITPSKLMLMIDTDGDGFDDESGIAGTYTAPWFEVTGVDFADGERYTIAQGESRYYAVASGNTSGAIWATTPAGAPTVLPSFCEKANLIVQPGLTITCDWATLACNKFDLPATSVFNLGSSTLRVNGNFTNDGIFNAQTGTLEMAGKKASTIGGSSALTLNYLNITNTQSVTISATGGGLVAKNLIQITAGVLNTNSLLNLLSDGTTSGMIGPLVTGDINGNISINRMHTALAQGWVNLCTPVQGKTIADWNDDLITTGFAGSDYPPPYPFNNVQHYNETVAGSMNQGFVGVTNVTNTIIPNKGYFVFMNAGVMNLDVDGQIFKGDQNMPLSYTNTGSPAGDGWNLISNPYPCTIDWDAAAWTKTNMDNAVYVWNAATGQYATYVNGVAANGGSRYVPHTQAFFVKANASAAALTIRENCKATVQGTFKNTQNDSGVLTLKITNGTYSDETTLAKNAGATLHFEGTMDALKLRSPLQEVPYMATLSTGGDDMSINAFATMKEETTIPLRMEVGVSGTYTLTHQGLEQFANGACIVLEDLATGNVYPLNRNENIELQLEVGNTALRYQLRIGATALANVTSAGCAGMAAGKAVVSVDQNGPYTITWTNSDDEVIGTAGNVMTDAEISSLTPGIYTVKIDGHAACGTTVSQFVIASDEPINATAILLPASCKNTDDGAIALNLSGGSGNYSVMWNNGATTESIEQLESGVYTAQVTDEKGCAQTFSFNIHISNTLSGSFDTPEVVYELHNGSVQVDFYNTSDNATDYVWMFGDNTINSEEENPSHVYNTKGVYKVSLIAANNECEASITKTIRVVNPSNQGTEFTSAIIGSLTDEGVRLMFFFNEAHRIKINAYNLLGQQLIEPIVGTYTRETITFSDRRYASRSIVEVTDLVTGERAIIKMGQ
jgi:PKD domain/SprB repeat